MKKILLLLLAFALFNCSKTDNNVTPETKTDLLTKNNWIINKYIVSTVSKSLDVYSKGGTGNLGNYDKYKATFLSDGTAKVEFKQTQQMIPQ